MKEGWNTLKDGQEVLVEDGRITRAVMLDHNGGRVTAAPYRWDAATQCWHCASGVKVETFTRGLRDGRYDIK